MMARISGGGTAMAIRVERGAGRIGALVCSLALSLWAVAPIVRAAPMTPGQFVQPADLSPVEMEFYRSLAPDAARDFLVTRSYVRVCKSVVEYKTPALQLPDRPEGFSAKYLLPTDPNIINRALIFYLRAQANPAEASHPSVLELSTAQRLQRSELSPVERAEFDKLAGEEQDSFIDTRSYVRVCRQYLDHQLPKDGLPIKPLGFNPGFLLQGEKAVVDGAITQSAGDALAGAVR